MNKLDHLPTELVSLILSFIDKKDLYTCTLVNKLLYNQSLPLLWRQLDITSEDELTTYTTIMASSPHSHGIHVRIVSLLFKLSGTSLLTFIQHVPFLEHLKLMVGTGITDTSFKHVPRYCPHILSLCIDRGDVTLLSMVALGQYCHQLQVLRLKLCPYLDYAPLFFALRTCPLKDIDITPCDMYRMESRHVSEAIAWSLHRDHQQLTSLAIQNSDNDYTAFITTSLKDGLTWPHLTRMCLDACLGMDDSMAIPFLQSHPNLISLELNGTNITDHTLDAIATYLSSVKEVRVHNNSQLTAAGICRLVKNCVHLEKGVWFSGCGIYLDHDDFPKDLDRCSYELEDVDERPEMIWLAGQCI